MKYLVFHFTYPYGLSFTSSKLLKSCGLIQCYFSALCPWFISSQQVIDLLISVGSQLLHFVLHLSLFRLLLIFWYQFQAFVVLMLVGRWSIIGFVSYFLYRLRFIVCFCSIPGFCSSLLVYLFFALTFPAVVKYFAHREWTKTTERFGDTMELFIIFVNAHSLPIGDNRSR